MPKPITKRVSSRTGVATWQVRVRVGTAPGGKPESVTKTFKKLGEARAFLTRTRQDKNEGKVVRESKLTLNQFLDRWLDSVKQSVRPQTAESYAYVLDRYVRPGLGGRRLEQVTALAIQGHFQTLAEQVFARRVHAPKPANPDEAADKDAPAYVTREYTLSARTVRYAYSILSAALKQAVRWRILTFNPAADVDKVRQPRREMQALGADEAKRFLAAIEGTRFEALFKLAVFTGMRPGEYLALKWQDIDLKKGAITVQRTLVKTAAGYRFDEPKTDRSRRTVPIPASVVEALRRHKSEQLQQRLKLGGSWEQPDLVFTNEVGGFVGRSNLLQRQFRTALKVAGLPVTLRLYDLRHTAATLLLAAGVHPKVASERLGHASITMTLDTYSHVLPDMQREASDKMEELLSVKPS
jgi:integrase